MNATEARRRTNSYTVGMANIYGAIAVAADDGDSCIKLGGQYFDAKDVERVMEKLREDGYVVERDRGYDQRDRESWDYLIVRW